MDLSFADFTNLYSVTKTLRFELKPEGRTLENIKSKGFLEKDRELKDNYETAKKVLDKFFKWFLDESLKSAKINPSAWLELWSAYENISLDPAEGPKNLDKVKTNLRKQITAAFKNYSNSKAKNIRLAFFMGSRTLKAKELIDFVIPQWLDLPDIPFVPEAERTAVKKFKGCCSSFNAFMQGRANIFTDEDIITGAARRIVSENFVKFAQNVKNFEILKLKLPEIIERTEASLKDFLSANNCLSLEQVFKITAYGRCINQNGIDFINGIIGGISLESGKKLRGLNEELNLCIQKNAQNQRAMRSLQFIKLYKQILSDSETPSFVSRPITSDSEFLNALDDFTDALNISSVPGGLLSETAKLLDWKKNSWDISKIYIKASELSYICTARLRKRWSYAKELIDNFYAQTNSEAKKKKNSKIITPKAYSLEFLSRILGDKFINFGRIGKLQDSGRTIPDGLESMNLNICAKYQALQKCFKKYGISKESTSKINECPEAVDAVKEFLDSVLDFQRLCRVISLTPESETDAGFYAAFEPMAEKLAAAVPFYNRTRSWLTSRNKTYGKFKLTFGCSTLADGWDLNKEKDNKTLILQKDGQFYLAVSSPIFKGSLNDPQYAGSGYKKMNYKYLPGPNKMLPKIFIASQKALELYHPSEELLINYARRAHIKGENFDIKFCRQLIDYFKECISRYESWKCFNFRFSPTETYSDISGFYREIECQGYKINFDTELDEAKIADLTDKGCLYLFKIYNKDFSGKSSGCKNLHTLYFLNAFSPENMANPSVQLCGEAEIFYRPKTAQRKITHPKGSILVNKTYKNAENSVSSIDADSYMQLCSLKNGHLKQDKLSRACQSWNESGLVKTSEARYDIIKDKRFTEDKFLFHVPFKFNIKSENISNCSDLVWDFLKNITGTGLKNLTVIGIGRGRGNLLQICGVNGDGEKLEELCCPLNIINGIDYRAKLNAREQQRLNQTRSWQKIDQIKDLQTGYLSAAVHKTAELAVKHNAVLILEDTGFGTRHGKYRIETALFQKFEKMLIDKLNYAAFKDVSFQKAGHILKGYQLSERFESFEKMGRQSGIMFFLPQDSLSAADPATGFVNLHRWSFETLEKAQTLFKSFDSIAFSRERGWFEFTFDYSRLPESRKASYYKTHWTICSADPENKSRFIYDKAQDTYIDFRVNEVLKDLFSQYSISYQSGNDIKEAVCSQSSKDFFKRLLTCLYVLCTMRFTNHSKGFDFILSPAADRSGRFYGFSEPLGYTADFTDAYHIAMKGLYLIKRELGRPKINGRYKHDLKFSADEYINILQHNAEIETEK